MTKNLFMYLLLALLLVSPGWAAEMTGYITCSKCRHTEAGQMDCAKNCIRNGVPAVFYDTSADKFYEVANQDAAKPHAGEHVTVTGSVEGETLTIESVKPASSED